MPITYVNLWNKSKLLLEKALARRNEGAFEDFQLGAALAVEILAKAALAKKHPVLVVDPQHFESVLVACGESSSSDCKTIQAKTLFARCIRLVPGFGESDEKFCMTLADRRNAELHSGAIPFTGVSIDSWQPKYWRVIKLLVTAQDCTLADLLGPAEGAAADEIISDASKSLEKAIEGRIAHHAARFKANYPTYTVEQIRKQSQIAARARLGSGTIETTCPACESAAVLEGSYIDERDVDTQRVEYGDAAEFESWVRVVETTYESESLTCFVCSLKLNGPEELVAASVESEFTQVEEKEIDYEDDYGND